MKFYYNKHNIIIKKYSFVRGANFIVLQLFFFFSYLEILYYFANALVLLINKITLGELIWFKIDKIIL